MKDEAIIEAISSCPSEWGWPLAVTLSVSTVAICGVMAWFFWLTFRTPIDE